MLGPDDVIEYFASTNPSYSSAKPVFTMAIRKIIPNADSGHIAFQTFETMHPIIAS
jgi:hypothetical protein